MNALIDTFGRHIDYLRISVTDRCNLRCVYCMPPEGVPWMPHDELLSYEEIATIVRIAARMGIGKVRLTGGEPLVRADLVTLVEMLGTIEGITEVSLTTNGQILAQHARELKRAGLMRVNISLDTLDSDRFHRITRLGDLSRTLEGIQAAEDAGLSPVKINMVVMRGINDDEVVDFARMTRERGWHVRFIELMPFTMADMVPSADIRHRIESLGVLEEGTAPKGNGPAYYYRLLGARGSIGFISPITEPFCDRCNRMRLSSDGHLYPCLLTQGKVDLKEPLRDGATTSQLQGLILEAVAAKPEHYHLAIDDTVCAKRKMSRIGG